MSASVTTARPVEPVPRVVVAMLHPTMRRYVCDLIEQVCRCWLATTAPDPAQLRDVVLSLHPDAIILESSSFPACCPDMAETYPIERVVIVGPYPDPAYRDAAMAAGAGAWIPRDRLAHDLIHELNRLTGQRHCTCGCHDEQATDQPATTREST